MNKLFLALYDLFRKHRKWLWTILILSTLGMGYVASMLSFNENIISFIPDDKQGHKTSDAFTGLRGKDRIIILIEESDSISDPDRMIEAANLVADGLQPAIDNGSLRSLTVCIDGKLMDAANQIIYNHLPIFYTDNDFARLDTITRAGAIENAIQQSYSLLTSPAGIALQPYLLRDPLGLGTHLLEKFRQFDATTDYELYNDHIFAPGLKTLLLFAEAADPSASASNERLISLLEKTLSEAETTYDVKTKYFGAAGIAVYNARQIKRDTMWTLSLSLLVIVLVFFLAFRNRRSIPLMIAPVAYGALFALAAIYFIQGSISNISIGAGAVVLGIALSYSIHILAHSNHTHDPRKIIEELAYPLTVGSFTTIGAFLGLLFMRSPLLHDFGLFSALTLVGTTLFSLIFLPHMLPAHQEKEESWLLRRIERLNAYRFDSNRWLAGLIVVATVVCLFFYNDVRFNSDMRKLNYEPECFKNAEQRLAELFGPSSDYVYLVTTSNSMDRSIGSYVSGRHLLDSLLAAGTLSEHASAADFVIPLEVQRERLNRWKSFWTEQKRRQVFEEVERNAWKSGFRKEAFAPLKSLLEKEFTLFDPSTEEVTENPILSDWFNKSPAGLFFVSRIALEDSIKPEVYPLLEQIPELSILDRSYFTNQMAEIVSSDFNMVLLISSLLVFLALLISYGRIELALLASLPMAISWILILGIMALAGIEFNIVNIILSTFIFGLGDDFSIFIMDGLLSDYRDGKKMLTAHKTAIFFAAFTTIVGIGTLIFAKHPALRSLALISIIGMLAVVLVAYTIQPILFRLLISRPTSRGGYPITMAAMLNSIYAFVYFFIGCILLQVYMLVLQLLPIGRIRRKAWFHHAIYGFTRLFLSTMFTTRTRRLNPESETFKRPAIIIANHQSFIDILLLLSTSPKLVMVTNNWVWNSPFFGRIVRYAGFHHAGRGYESLTESIQKDFENGYSVVIFPEGTRSEDCAIHRFHKGAFLVAEKLHADIVPVLIYGAGQICSKTQPFYIKRGDLTGLILPRITPDDTRFGVDVRERAKKVRTYMTEEYEKLKALHTNDPHHRSAVIRNYIYKGPVLEWYIRIKLYLEKNYDVLDKWLPRDARIVDIGCGYGQAAFMLALRGDRRRLLGLDYDADKMALVDHCFLTSDRIRFQCSDITSCELPEADVFLLNDMLHYLNPDAQRQLLGHCAEKLSSGGRIVIRDGDTSFGRKHRLTERTELWSTRILGFNKTKGNLHFISTKQMKDWAESLGLHVEMLEPVGRTSNHYYIFRKGGTL